MEKGNQPVYADPMRGAEQSFTNQYPHTLPTGLTLREYFAGLAMQGLLANYYAHGMFGNALNHPNVSAEAVKCADDLLAELSK